MEGIFYFAYFIFGSIISVVTYVFVKLIRCIQPTHNNYEEM